MSWRIELTKTAIKDISLLSDKQKLKLKEILRQISSDPTIGKALIGDLKGYFSVRLSLKDRVVYRIEKDRLIVVILRCRSHYGE
jgi:Txe/YoeB family toxin of Txe-Axe toxin-antitoxin module